MSNNKLLHVVVRNTDTVLYDGESDRVSSFNEVGRFDIFPMHANFISIINQEVAIYLKNKIVKQIKIDQAIMKVKQDNVSIFLGIETLFVDENSINTPR